MQNKNIEFDHDIDLSSAASSKSATAKITSSRSVLLNNIQLFSDPAFTIDVTDRGNMGGDIEGVVYQTAEDSDENAPDSDWHGAFSGNGDWATGKRFRRIKFTPTQSWIDAHTDTADTVWYVRVTVQTQSGVTKTKDGQLTWKNYAATSLDFSWL